MEPLRILLVDDHALFRKGVASLLESRQDMQVVGEAGDGCEAIARARELTPDIILMDIAMPGCNGLQATWQIKREMPHVKIIMLTVSDYDRDLFAAIKNGAQGYLLKNLEPYKLFDMLDRARRGEAAISGMLAAKILQEFREPRPELVQRPEVRGELTAREIEILEQVVQGASNKEIAVALSISDNTVKIHLRNILEKLHLQNRIQAAVYAVREGLVGDSSPAQ
jgi:DNA-binding NarL/FixJ family response regulator